MKCGIYGILNVSNGKWYIGQTVNSLHLRKIQHFSTLRNKRHSNTHLQRAFIVYGEDSFEFRILETCNEDMLDIRERSWIRYHKSNDGNFGYNSESGGNAQKHLSDDHKAKVIKSLIGNKRRNGIPHTQEHKAKLSQALTGSGNHLYGKRHTEETKRKISGLMKGNNRCIGRVLSEETKRKIAQSLTGKKLSAEVRAKMSIAQKNRNKTREKTNGK